MRVINKIIIHCTATEEGINYTVDNIRQWHKQRDFYDIGYHYVIDINGMLHIGRPLSRQGAHCKGQNKDSIGICYVGGLRNGKPADTRNEDQKYMMNRLVTEMKKQFMTATIHGHNEFSDKACPCFDVSKEF